MWRNEEPPFPQHGNRAALAPPVRLPMTVPGLPGSGTRVPAVPGQSSSSSSGSPMINLTHIGMGTPNTAISNTAITEAACVGWQAGFTIASQQLLSGLVESFTHQIRSLGAQRDASESVATAAMRAFNSTAGGDEPEEEPPIPPSEPPPPFPPEHPDARPAKRRISGKQAAVTKNKNK